MNIDSEVLNIQKDLYFSDEEANLYQTYLSLKEIRLNKPCDEDFLSLSLNIAKESFQVKDNLDCFKEEKDSIILNLDRLLGLTDRLQSQVLTFILKGKKNESTTRIVFLNRYILLKDPRKEENKNHMTVLLNTLVLDYLYTRDEITSNLKVNLDGKKLYFLLNKKD